MGIGMGILLIVLGAILLFALNLDIPFVTDDTLGVILIVAGVLALVLALILNYQRGRTKHVQESRYDGRRRSSDPPAELNRLLSIGPCPWVEAGRRAHGAFAKIGGSARSMVIDQVMWVRIGASTPPPARRCSATTVPSTAAAKTSTGLPPATVASE